MGNELILLILSMATTLGMLVLMAMFFASHDRLKELQTTGKLETKKGSYTFTRRENK